MTENYTIGNAPIDVPAKLSFHQYTIYDSVAWDADGYLCWNATERQFYVQPFVPPPEKTENSANLIGAPQRLKKIEKK